jgi:hypothetical protein
VGEEREMSRELEQIIRQGAEHDGTYAIAHALMGLTRAIERLGTGDAATPMGAIEFLGAQVREVANTLRSLSEIAEAIERHKAPIGPDPLLVEERS